MINVIFKPAYAFGTLHNIGAHHLIRCEYDIDNALDNAACKGFQTVYLYVFDLSVVRYARELQASYASENQYSAR